MHYCGRCDNTRWICETHVGVPFLGKWACGCGAAGAPCPDCNKLDPANPVDVPTMPRGFKSDPGQARAGSEQGRLPPAH
jgi:hypothetical protein